MIKKIKLFVGEAKQELKKTSWSTKEELISSTIVVIFAVMLLVIFIGIVDFALAHLVNILIK